MPEWSIKNTELWGVSVAALGVFALWNKEMDFTNLTFTVWLLKILNFGSSNHLAKLKCKLVVLIETGVSIFFPSDMQCFSRSRFAFRPGVVQLKYLCRLCFPCLVWSEHTGSCRLKWLLKHNMMLLYIALDDDVIKIFQEYKAFRHTNAPGL